jgi:hypothetical protein
LGSHSPATQLPDTHWLLAVQLPPVGLPAGSLQVPPLHEPLQQLLVDEQLAPAAEHEAAAHLPPTQLLLAQSLGWAHADPTPLGTFGPPPQVPALQAPVQQSLKVAHEAPAERH